MTRADEITAMREWITETARRLSTFSQMPTSDEIDALSDEQVTEVVERHYAGGVRLFRWTVRNGGQP